MTLHRADRLKEPPVVGRWYFVPAILWNRNGFWTRREQPESEIIRDLQESKGSKWWPVWGNKHNDIEHFNFAPLHYHIDPRFLTKRHLNEVWSGSRTKMQSLQAQPLAHIGLKSGPPKPTLRRMRCVLSHAEWGHAGAEKVNALNSGFAGRQCRSGKRGFVCPHKHFPLGSIEAVDGVVTCPLHGLRIDASSGVVLANAPVTS